MERNFFRGLKILTLTLLLFSCNKDYQISIAPSLNSELIPIDVAKKVAVAYAQNNFSLKKGGKASKSALKTNSLQILKEIESEEAIKNGESPYFYIFNFKNKSGWVIISAEKREHPILAYCNDWNIRLFFFSKR